MTTNKPPQSGQGARLESRVGTLADKIEWLIQRMWPPEIKPATTNEEIARAIREITGEQKITGSTLVNLRNGRSENPTLRTLRAIAKFFKVPIGYFGDDEYAEKIESQLTLLALVRDGGVDALALRTLVDLSPEGQKMIAEMIASAARMEQSRSG